MSGAPEPSAVADFVTFHTRLLGWRNLLLVLGLGLGLWLNHAGQGSMLLEFNIDLGLMAACVMGWHALAGIRLVRLFGASARLRLPGLWPHAAVWIGVSCIVGVLLPALLQATYKPDVPGIFHLTLASMAVAAATGLLWASMPVWAVWIALASSGLVLLAWGTGTTGGVSAATGSAGWMAALAAALLAASVFSLRHALGPHFRASTWTTPLALQMSTAPGSGIAATGIGPISLLRLLGMTTPVPDDLRAQPGLAMEIALGPGFGRVRLADFFLLCQLPLTVCIAWLILPLGSIHTGLVFAPLLVLALGLAPLQRLQLLLVRPTQGLHELGLLPGLATPTARALEPRLLRAVILRTLPPLAMVLGFAVAADAASGYYLSVLAIVTGGLCLGLGLCVFTLRRGAQQRWILGLGVTGMLLLVLVVMNLYQALSPAHPHWIWAPLLLALAAAGTGLALRHLGLLRLDARPALWQQN